MSFLTSSIARYYRRFRMSYDSSSCAQERFLSFNILIAGVFLNFLKKLFPVRTTC